MFGITDSVDIFIVVCSWPNLQVYSGQFIVLMLLFYAVILSDI